MKCSYSGASERGSTSRLYRYNETRLTPRIITKSFYIFFNIRVVMK